MVARTVNVAEAVPPPTPLIAGFSTLTVNTPGLTRSVPGIVITICSVGWIWLGTALTGTLLNFTTVVGRIWAPATVPTNPPPFNSIVIVGLPWSAALGNRFESVGFGFVIVTGSVFDRSPSGLTTCTQ